MRYFEILNENVNLRSVIKPAVDILTADGKDKALKEINEAIKKVKAWKNTFWQVYYLKIFRVYVLLKNNIDVPSKLFNIPELTAYDSPSKGTLQYLLINIQRYFDHFNGIRYKPIRDYNPIGMSIYDAKEQLDALEKDYLATIDGDTRLIKAHGDENIIKSYPDGFHWIMLPTGYCEKEATAMGHCGNINAKSNERIISLRKKEKRRDKKYYTPYITFIYNDENGLLGERKGRANERPVERYHPYIVDLLKMPMFEGFSEHKSYMPENDFQLTDLTQEQQEEVVASNNSFILYMSRIPDQYHMIAVAKDPTTIQRMDNPSEEVQLKAVKENGNLIQYINNPSDKVQLEAVIDRSSAIQFIDNPSEKVQLASLEPYADGIMYIKNPTRKVKIKAVNTDPWAILYMINPSEEIQLLSVKIDGLVLEDLIAEGIKPSEEVQMEAVKQKPQVYLKIANPTSNVTALYNRLKGKK